MPHSLKTLILYTRFPAPGTSKTRLVPALGAQGAAGLHRRLTEHTLHQADLFCLRHGVSLEIHFAGGDQEAMRQWLGSHTFKPQSTGSLGERMAQTFQQAFTAGAAQAVIIGTDCPGLTAEILVQAFSTLRTSDLVLGPAMDGGYYLIGLTKPRPSLFSEIDWGTPSVLKQTLAKAHALTISQLPPLHDIDRPEDLAHFDYHSNPE
jgi:rSAM/selenodomain-associated transferase 1